MGKIRLKTNNAQEVRRTLGRICNMLANNEMDPKTANAIIYACNVILGAIRTDEQQKKLDELEKIVKGLTE